MELLLYQYIWNDHLQFLPNVSKNITTSKDTSREVSREASKRNNGEEQFTKEFQKTIEICYYLYGPLSPFIYTAYADAGDVHDWYILLQ